MANGARIKKSPDRIGGKRNHFIGFGSLVLVGDVESMIVIAGTSGGVGVGSANAGFSGFSSGRGLTTIMNLFFLLRYFAIIVVVPGFFALTLPFLTVAIDFLELVHLIFFLFTPLTLKVNFAVSPTVIGTTFITLGVA